MNEIEKIFNALSLEASTLAKVEIINKNKDNDLLKRIFEMTLNPFFNYFIRISEIPADSGKAELTIELLNDIFDKLNNRVLTGNSARNYVNNILIDLKKEHQQILINVLNRDLNCKVARGLVNRVWKDLIPEFPCMLAESYDEKTAINIKEGKDSIIVQKKEDGGRVAIVVNEKGQVTVFSRNGNSLETHSVFDTLFQHLAGYVFDGELLIVDSLGTQDRKASNGIFNKAVRSTITKEEATKFHVILWDVIPIDAWKSGFYSTPYIDRLKLLSQMTENMPSHRASIVETKIVSYHYEVQKFYEKMLSLGYEGAIVKTSSMPWENKRSKQMLKLKEVKDTSLLCVGVQRHSKNPNWIGSLDCETSDGKLKVSIGSGLTEADRMLPATHYIDKIIDVKYNMIISNKNTDEKSLFLPRYMGIRHDQSIADSIDKIR
jgi:ATP-dependent DNA ligase